MRRVWLAVVAGCAVLAACSEGLLRETAPLAPAQLGIVASFHAAAGGADQAFSRTNRLYLRFSADGVVRSEQTLTFDASAAEVRVPIEVPLRAATETFALELELRRDSEAVFQAATTVTLSTGAATAVEVVLQPVVARVTCTGPPVLIDAIGATQQLSGAALFATDDTIFGVPLQWTSPTPAVVRVTPQGVAEARAEGEVVVQCSAAGHTDTRTVRVAAAVASVVVTPPQLVVNRGEDQPLTAVVRDRLGNLLVGRTITWTSSAGTVASVNSAGMVSGVSVGTARIDATTGGVTGSATVSVRDRAPTVSTGPAQVTTTTATLTGTVDPHGLPASAWFEYSTSSTLQGAAATPATAVAAGNGNVQVTALLNQLGRGITYYYRVAARNEVGESRGSILTLQLPINVASASIDAVTLPGGAAVNPEAVAGDVDVRVNVVAAAGHGVRAVALFVGDVEACRESYQQPLVGSTVFECRIDTAAADADGVPRFANGPRVLRAVAYTAAGDEVARGEFCSTAGNACTVVLANPNTVRMVVAGAGPSATDAAGQRWWRSLTVHATPVVFDAGERATSMRVLVLHGDNVITVDAGLLSGPGPHLVTVSPEALSGVEDLVRVHAEVTTSSGALYTSADPAAQPEHGVRIDTRAPTLSSLGVPPHNAYVGSRFTFEAAAVDGGSGTGTLRFDVVPAVAPTAAPVTGGAGVTTAETLPESPSSDSYALRVTATDRLGNSTVWYGQADGSWRAAPGESLARFGVERTDPVLQVSSGPQHNSTNSQDGGWLLAFYDPAGFSGSASGINPDSVRVRLVRYNADSPHGACVDPRTPERGEIGGVADLHDCFVSLDAAQPYVSAPLWSSEDEDEGYFTMTAFVVDNAGNRSEWITRTTLYDGTPATVDNITVPAVVTGGQAATFGARVMDNVDLGDVVSVLGFHGDTAAWLVQGRTRLSPYGPPVVTNTQAQFTTDAFIRSITETQSGEITSRRAVATWIEFVARDEAGVQRGDPCLYWWECSREQLDITSQVAAGMGGASFRDWTLLSSADPLAAFYSDEGVVALNGATASFQVHMEGSSALQNPFARVVFYMRQSGSAGFRAEPIGVGSTSVADAFGRRTYTFTTSVSAAGIPDGWYSVFALGVDGNGDSLMSGSVYILVDGGRFYAGNAAVAGEGAITAPVRGSLQAPSGSRQ